MAGTRRAGPPKARARRGERRTRCGEAAPFLIRIARGNSATRETRYWPRCGKRRGGGRRLRPSRRRLVDAVTSSGRGHGRPGKRRRNPKRLRPGRLHAMHASPGFPTGLGSGGEAGGSGKEFRTAGEGRHDAVSGQSCLIGAVAAKFPLSCPLGGLEVRGQRPGELACGWRQVRMAAEVKAAPFSVDGPSSTPNYLHTVAG
jgi:hypothetical protein